MEAEIFPLLRKKINQQVKEIELLGQRWKVQLPKEGSCLYTVSLADDMVFDQ